MLRANDAIPKIPPEPDVVKSRTDSPIVGMREVPSVMGFFRKKHRESASRLEDVAEDEGATPHRGFKGFPNLIDLVQCPRASH